MAQQIQFRRDTAARWTSINPILGQGEPGLETDTKKFKIGDGTTTWVSLAYVAAQIAADSALTGVFAQRANNLSDVASAGTSRANLGLGTASTLASSAVAQTANNLSDLANVSTARTNLGLGTAATLASSAIAQTANNLSDLASAATARTNLGLGSAATQASTVFAQVANNLSDLVSAATARTNLGLVAIATSGSASDLSAGSVPTGRFGATTVPISAINASGSASSSTFLRGDGSWQINVGANLYLAASYQ